MTDDFAGTWPLLQRSEEVAAVLAGLAAPGAGGTLIVGSPGVGKTAIARAAVAQLEATSHVVLIRGSAAMASTPYGALTVLLMDADPVGSLESLPMLQSLQTALRLRARSRPAILVVDNVQHLDEPSTRVLSYLAEVGAARLLVACDGPSSAAARFFDLWRKGRLVRVDVPPLGFEGMLALLGQLLEGPLSGAAAVELWHASHGNLRYLQAAVRGSVASGMLTRAPGAWVWHGTDDGARAQGNEGIHDAHGDLGALPALSERARAALDVVAVAGPVPLDALLTLCGADVVDELEQAGLCVLDPDPPHAVDVVNTLIGDRVRAALAANPLPAFLQQLEGLEAGGLLPPPGRLNLLRWFLGAEVPVPDAYLRGAARTANDAGEPALALRAAGHLAAVDTAALEEVRACLRERRFSEGRSVLSRVLAGGPPSDPERVADEARALAVEAAVHEGRHADVLDLAEAKDEESLLGEGRADAMALERAARIILARSLTGAGPGARRSLARLRGTELPAPVGTATRTLQENGFAALVHEGCLDDALLLTGAAALAAGQWQDAAVSDTLTGAALAAHGQGEAALAVIVPALEQLRVDNRSGLLPLADAAAAYTAALLGRDAPGPATVPAGADDSRAAEGLPWAYRSAIGLLTTLSDSLLADSDVAARRFVVLANGQRKAGNHGVELNLRMHALRLGQQSQSPLLLELARRIDTPLAAACELLAHGVAARDPHVLLQTAEVAYELGHLDLAGSAALISMRLHETEDEPLHFIRAEQIFRRTHVPRRNASARRILTDRERTFARMAARGASNKEVAAANHLSVRTVEGHILKAMAKLGISSRKQLSTVFTR